MFKRMIVVLHEQHIGKVMCGIFVYFAVTALAGAVQDPFLNRVVHLFNTHTREFRHAEPRIVGLDIALKSFDVVLFSILAWVFYR